MTLRIDQMTAMRERSGNIHSKDPLVSFLYLVMRDHVTPGAVEGLVMDSIDKEAVFTNGWLAKYAEDIADRLKTYHSDYFEDHDVNRHLKR